MTPSLLWKPTMAATLPADALTPHETALFCIGAHMSGLPLNGQVTSLGGRFVREARTAPGYKLFAMGARPGMVRAAGGAAIAGEVWALGYKLSCHLWVLHQVVCKVP